MGHNKQKRYKQTDLGVLAEGKVCVTMGCGKQAVPETRGVPEGLCYSWASRSLGHCSCLEACLARRSGSIQDRASSMVAACPGVHPVHRPAAIPPCSAACCWGWCRQDAPGLSLFDTHSFPTGFVWFHSVPMLLPSPELTSGFLWLLGCAGDWTWPHS